MYICTADRKPLRVGFTNTACSLITTQVFETFAATPTRPCYAIAHPSNAPTTDPKIGSRVSLLDATSVLRQCGIYGSVTNLTNARDRETNTRLRIGFPIPALLVCLTIDFDVSRSLSGCFVGLHCGIKFQPRVPFDAPLMVASKNGDLKSMRSLLHINPSLVNDRTLLEGRTPLMVSPWNFLKFLRASRLRITRRMMKRLRLLCQYHETI